MLSLSLFLLRRRARSPISPASATIFLSTSSSIRNGRALPKLEECLPTLLVQPRDMFFSGCRADKHVINIGSLPSNH
ncbi:hypothetical protein EUGRSUZ_F03762 [Eucalyptus grandis]|uniref:Uncharacterized protein n=2 Tax=Eucalyptus grandis TaxID=71139 RepID=A0ACC3KMR5_EUCGR|nr:hypothetical protein EUGRSUZ_F03762 [Eucalyptus grandis]